MQSKPRSVAETLRKRAATILGRSSVHTPEIDGFWCRKTDATDAWRNRRHKKSVLAVSDGGAVAILAYDGAGNEFAARGRKKAAAVEKRNALKRFTTSVGARQIVIGIASVSLIIILHVSLDDRALVGLCKQVRQERRAHPIVVIQEGEVDALRRVDGEVSRIGNSWRRRREELNMEAVMSRCDIVSNLHVIRLHIAVEYDNHLKVF